MTALLWLRITAFLEGVSFLLLLFVAMPLKYLAGQPAMVRQVGMIHGILFVAFLALALVVKDAERWPMRKAALAILASVIPFGTFWAEFKLFRTVLALFAFCSLVARPILAQPAVDLPRASPAAMVSQKIGYTRVTVEYSRPAVKDRAIWGGLVPLGKVWRAGANEATVIEFSTDVKVDGHPLPKGRYGFFIVPDEKEWALIFSKVSKTWGAFTYDEKEDALRLHVPAWGSEFKERLEYGFEDLTDSSASLCLRWEKRKVAVGITVEFMATALANIKNGLPKAKPDDAMAWLNAARFYWNYGIDRKQAMAWVDKSIKIKPGHANLWDKAQWLAEDKQYAEAVKVAAAARAEAGKDPNPKFLLESIDKAAAQWAKGLPAP
jgi:integral membrane protein